MPTLFGVDIAGIINQEMGSLLLPLTVTRITDGVRTPGAIVTGPTQATSVHAGRGIISDYETKFRANDLIKEGDREVMILGASIDIVPAPGDRVTIEGGTYDIVSVSRDPAAATYLCQSRRQ